MYTLQTLIIVIMALGLIVMAPLSSPHAGAKEIALPSPSHKSEVSVEEALKNRRTHRSFKTKALSLDQFSQ
ncbi:MAG: hypothetical protein JRF41_02245, partial [Deltaproteobacteria bacterium]|nr:hypothetical protein [Deltaproteobacteria bacterium]